MNANNQVSKRAAFALAMFIVSVALTFSCGSLAAAEPDHWQAGARLGFDDGRNDEDFNQGEVFVARLIPLSFASNTNLSLAVSLEGSAGILSGASTQGFVGAVGPGLAAGLLDGRLVIKAGISPTIISQDQFGDEDLGGPVQFTSHAGLAFKVYSGVSVGYRFQHMSNAGLYHHNPGLNLHMIEFAWWF